MLKKSETATDRSGKADAVVIKKYANRRLYNTETSSYVTLEDLAKMVRSDRDFVVFDAKTGDDLTHSVLTQIIVEQEARGSGPNLLPIPFLRQLIRFYDDIGMGRFVPSYLQVSLEALAKEQERLRSQFSSFGPSTAFDAYQEQARKNIAMFEKAMAMWSPFVQPGRARPDEAAFAPAAEPASTVIPAAQPAGPASRDEIADLRAELERMQAKIERLSRDSD